MSSTFATTTIAEQEPSPSLSFENLLGRICNTKFWDHDLCWATSNPTLTPCFVDTALVWPPIIFIWLMLPYSVHEYMITKRQLIPYNCYNVIKLSMAILMVLVEFIQFIHMIIIYNSNDYDDDRPEYASFAHVLALFLNTITYLLMVFYIHMQRIKGFVNCGVVWFFLLFTLISSGLTIPVAYQYRPFELWLYLPVKLTFLVILFLICSFSDSHPKQKTDQSNHCPKDKASIPSKLTFRWFNSLAMLGYRRPLTIKDLWIIRKHDSSRYLMGNFQRICKREICSLEPCKKNSTKTDSLTKKNCYYNLWKILAQMFWKYFMFPTLGRLGTDLLQLANPIVLRLMIDYTVSSDVEIWHGILYSLTFFAINMIQSWSAVYQQHRYSVLALRIRSTLIGAIYRKSLVLAQHARKDFSTGDIVNLMAVDSQRVIDLVRFINYLWTAPILIAIGFYLLWGEIGKSVSGGFILMFLMIPIQGIITRRIKSIQIKQMQLKDSRLRAINELLNGMKIMKLYAWENAFIKNVRKIRLVELAQIRLAGLITAIYVVIAVCSPFLITFTVFAVYTQIDGEKLTSEKAFVTIALFNLLRVPLNSIPNMLTTLILTIVSMKRISRFLNADEVDHYVEREFMKSPDEAIQIHDASFSWEQKNLILTNINLSVQRKKLVAVVGQVGSGKSSLLSALLGEMQIHSGQVKISEGLRVAYVAQQAWIQNLTARDNILFGLPYSKEKYDQVIESCALKSDFGMLSGGDLTEIGEKGINLSGGQKQRISIARACYSDADLYYFDDPLSAVDSHVGKHIFEKVLSSKDGILRDKTRILVTNALYVLPMVDEVILLKNGTIAAIGSCQQLLKENESFRELLDNYHKSSTDSNEGDQQFQQTPVDGKIKRRDSKPNVKLQRQITTESIHSDSESIDSLSLYQPFAEDHSVNKQKKLIKSEESDGKLVEQESVETGQISWKVYKKFINSLTPLWFTIIVALYVLTSAFGTGANFWLASWTKKVDSGQEIGGYELWTYFGIGFMQLIFISTGWTALVLGCLRASNSLHERLMDSIVHAPMYFFDTTPLGRIMNRFSRDIDLLDNAMAFLMRVILIHFTTVIFTLFVISFNTPMFMAFVVPFLIVYFCIQRFYVTTSRQLKRIESVSRSPIFTHFSETVNGVSTIKAYGACQRFIEESNIRVDQNFQCYYPIQVADCWLSIRVEFLANCLIFFASFMSTLTKLIAEDGNGLTGSQIGLSLSYALNITLSLNWCVRVSAEFENNVVSVERISEYIDVEPEAPWNLPDDEKLPKEWPSMGTILLDKYATRYRPGLDLVLKSVDLSIKKGEKIGIVGRTGAGKSSLTLGLFRLVEAAQGRICIDGVDISSLGLHKLRSRLTIIPQDPVLFSGTIRFNLDPFNNYTDEQLWTVLELSYLKQFVLSQNQGLNYLVNEAGENLSVGQRQLFCLSRALLRRTNVLVLDEATAAVDFETDALIQKTIRKEFNHCTILTIAHRLNTIMDSDRVLVLDAGRVAEFDTPKSLLSNRSTIFASLAKDAGITHYTFDNVSKSQKDLNKLQ